MAFINRLSASGVVNGFKIALKRNMGVASVCQSKVSEVSDPIQKLFLEKLHEYKAKATKLKDGELFDSNPEIEGKKKFGIENLKKKYGDNVEEFPKFSFEK
nr:ATP synthase-coupling factor 6, mitochondrial [Hydra vulgaris]